MLSVPEPEKKGGGGMSHEIIWLSKRSTQVEERTIFIRINMDNAINHLEDMLKPQLDGISRTKTGRIS